jgi:hypothetical protein
MSEKPRDGITMFWRKKNNFDDVTTSELMSKGIYSVQYPEEKQNKWWIAWKEHNILTGMWYIFILSCLLWWLPVFGQMIAGYLGGRRAGSPTKGVMVAIIPVFIIMLLLVGMDAGLFPFLVSLAQVPSMMINGLSGISPSAGSYLGGIFESLKPLVGINGNGLLIILVFAMIGGLMADMNKKEIAKATGGSGMFGGFSAMASAASLNKLADMVAERVIWTMGLVGNGSKTLIATTHRAPKEMGFSDLEMLPASTSEPSEYSSFNETEAYQPSQSYAYEDQIYEEQGFTDIDDPLIKDVSVEPISEEEYVDDGEWGISHFDLTEESMTDRWIEQNKRMEPKTPRKKYGNKKGKRSARLHDDRGERSPKKKGKRDAMVFDGDGNEIIKPKPKRKKAQPKKKQSSLITRTMEADKKMNREPEKVPEVLEKPEPQEDIMAAEEIMEKVARPRTKPVASYERL